MKIQNVNLTYEEVEKRHPQELAKLIDTLRGSTSKQKNENPKKMQFSYHYALSGKSYTLDEVIAGVPGREPRPETEDEFVEDYLARATPVTLQAKLGRWWGAERVPNPPELEIEFRRWAEQDAREKARINRMTRKQKDDEVAELLSGLSGSPGFFAVGVK